VPEFSSPEYEDGYEQTEYDFSMNGSDSQRSSKEDEPE
jgi:hypothetical protein